MISELQEQKKQLISYLLSKVKAEDWHAVQDAASDIREIEARLEVYELYGREKAAQVPREEIRK